MKLKTASEKMATQLQYVVIEFSDEISFNKYKVNRIFSTKNSNNDHHLDSTTNNTSKIVDRLFQQY